MAADEPLYLSGLQLNELPDIMAVDVLNETDHCCLGELREVLRRHGRTQKFGIALLHKHFNLASDEVLLETCDVTARTLLATPIKRSTVDKEKSITTLWRFADSAESNEKECEKVCPTDADGRHRGSSDHY